MGSNYMLKELERIGTPEELQEYQCRTFSLTYSHSILGVVIHNSSSVWHLYFLGTYYFGKEPTLLMHPMKLVLRFGEMCILILSV